jgi:hypothetical protein
MQPPNFFIIGAPRSGTTSLYSYLNQHPEIEMSSQKEAGYFHFVGAKPDFDALASRYGAGLLNESIQRYNRAERLSILDEAAYQSLWSGDHGAVRGEATPTYLFDPAAALAMSASAPESKLIVILRNPVDRAYSEYLQSLRLGLEQHNSFEAAIAAEPVDVQDYWWGARRYIRSGFYASNLERFMNVWPVDRIQVYFYEQLEEDVPGLLQDCFRFLGVDSDVVIDTSTRHKKGFVPAQTFLVRVAQSDSRIKQFGRKIVARSIRERLYHRILARRVVEPPPFRDETRRALAGRFSEDLRRLNQLVGGVPTWLTP